LAGRLQLQSGTNRTRYNDPRPIQGGPRNAQYEPFDPRSQGDSRPTSTRGGGTRTGSSNYTGGRDHVHQSRDSQPQETHYAPTSHFGDGMALNPGLSLEDRHIQQPLIEAAHNRNHHPSRRIIPLRPVPTHGPKLTTKSWPNKRQFEAHKFQNNDQRVGDIIHYDHVTGCQLDNSHPNVEKMEVSYPNSETPEQIYLQDKLTFPSHKGVYHVPERNIIIYGEARYGIIVEIHECPFGRTATVLPLYSYGGNGVGGHTIASKVQHMPVVLRSEWEDLLDKAQDDVIDGKIKSLDDAKANPIVPNQFVPFATELERRSRWPHCQNR
jgi:hypothetical protein